MDKYVLTIDCGTQSVRAIIFDIEGNLCDIEKIPFDPYFSIKPGFAEQYVGVFWENTCKACKALKERQRSKWDKIIGMSVTTQRDTVINIDKKGNILRPAIIWCDQRMAKCKEPLPIGAKLVLAASGMTESMDEVRKKSKANWIIENEEEIWGKTHKYLLLSGYFTYKLTGNLCDSKASQIGHIPFHYKKRNWANKNNILRWNLFGVDRERLPNLIEPGQILGTVTRKAAEDTGIREGLPVVASGSDKGCETLGNGCLDLNSVSISFGTSATVQTTSKRYFEPIRFMPAYPAVMPGRFNPEIGVFRGYWMISWFKKEFCTDEVFRAIEKNMSTEEFLNYQLLKIPPGSNGLILQPYWGAGLRIPEAKGSVIGFGDVHTKYHLYRSIVEGINFALYEGIEKIEKRSKNKVKNVIASGGGAQSDVICQIASDMFNLPVNTVQTYETSGLGAAISTFVGLGVYSDYESAVRNMVKYNRSFNPNTANAQIYKELYNKVYKKMYNSLRDIYKDLKKIVDMEV